MKVICINDSNINERDKVPYLIKGNIYHVVDEREVFDFKTKAGRKTENGIYYILIETGDCAYHSSLFIRVNETHIDELELINERILTTTNKQ